MARVYVTDEDLTGIKDKVILITGGASGIGRATVRLCLGLGAKVLIGDLKPPTPEFESKENPKFLEVNVTKWESLRSMFTYAMEQFGRIDHVFANAGVGPTLDFLDVKLDEAGQVEPPNPRTINVNFLAVLQTLHLANAYMTKLAPENAGIGSIVLCASCSAFETFSTGDYTIAKHGVLGMIRGFVEPLRGKVRLNAVAPSWTDTGLMPSGVFGALGVTIQPPEAVAQSVALLFADEKRHGDVIYSWDGKFREVNNAEGGLLQFANQLLDNTDSEESAVQKLLAMGKAPA
ncbi:hypothetical protein N7490_004976 [Penicillium lividum]|nr:hypothetical protein N7490_004976 [Penicillium lividum]